MRGRSQDIVVVVTPAMRADATRSPDGYEGRLKDSDAVLARTREPFLDAARALLASGCDPSAMLIMRHGGSDADCLRATIRVAAGLTVGEDQERGPRFKRWKPFSSGAVAARIAANDNAAITLPGPVGTTRRRAAAA